MDLYFGWVRVVSPALEQLQRVLDIRIAENGYVRLACGRAAKRRELDGWVAPSDEQPLLIFEPLIAGLTARLILLAGKLYQQAQYAGPVSLGVCVSGINGGVSWMAADPSRFSSGYEPYSKAEYRRTTRQEALVLEHDPITIARELTKPLIRATTQGQYDPFADLHGATR